MKQFLITEKRGLNCHTLEDGRRKPKDEDVGIAAHAYGVRTACLLASLRKFPTFSSTSKSNTLLVNSYVFANRGIDDAKLQIIFDMINMFFNILSLKEVAGGFLLVSEYGRCKQLRGFRLMPLIEIALVEPNSSQ